MIQGPRVNKRIRENVASSIRDISKMGKFGIYIVDEIIVLYNFPNFYNCTVTFKVCPVLRIYIQNYL